MSTKTNHNTQSAEEQMHRLKAVKSLPAPVPGVVVTIPLALWPLYMDLYQIEPKLYRIETRCLIVKKQESA